MISLKSLTKTANSSYIMSLSKTRVSFMENMFIYPKTYFQPSTKVLRKLTIEKKKIVRNMLWYEKSGNKKQTEKKRVNNLKTTF